MWLQAARVRGASVGALIRDWWVAYRRGTVGLGGAGQGWAGFWGGSCRLFCAWVALCTVCWALQLLTAALLAVLWIPEAWCSSAGSPAENLDGGGHALWLPWHSLLRAMCYNNMTVFGRLVLQHAFVPVGVLNCYMWLQASSCSHSHSICGASFCAAVAATSQTCCYMS